MPSYVTAVHPEQRRLGRLPRGRPRCELDKYKDVNIYKTLLVMDNEDDRKIFYKTKGAVEKLIGLFKALIVRSATRTLIERFEEVADRYDVTLPDVRHDQPGFRLQGEGRRGLAEVGRRDPLHVASTTRSSSPSTRAGPIPTYDWVFGDEAQDWSPLNIELVKQLGRSGRVVAVGDRFQSIYGFRGADPDAIPNIIRELDAAVLPLNYCYRCPTVGDRGGPGDRAAHRGARSRTRRARARSSGGARRSSERRCADGEYVLCRTTAPLVKRCLKMIGRQRKATVKGRDIGQGLVAFLEDLCPDAAHADPGVPRPAQRLQARPQSRSSRRPGRDTEAQAVEDRCDTLEVLAMDCDTTGDIKRRIERGVQRHRQSGSHFYDDPPLARVWRPRSSGSCGPTCCRTPRARSPGRFSRR